MQSKTSPDSIRKETFASAKAMAIFMEKNPIEQLFDENNNENVVLFDEEGKPCEFEQIAVIPMNEKVFCILRPIDMPDMGEDEALVFEVVEIDDEDTLEVVMEDETVDAVFDIYYSLLDGEEK